MPGIEDIWAHANSIIRTSRIIINKGLKPLNLSSAEGNVLMHLFTQGDGKKQEDIVEQLDISKPAVSRAVESLERKGYVKRRRSFDDRRISQVFLTYKAKEMATKVQKVYHDLFTAASQGVPKERIRDFTELFCQVSMNLTHYKNGDKDAGRRLQHVD